MKIFTVRKNEVSEGADVTKLHIKSANVDIPVITVGEEGRGRQLGVLAIDLNKSRKEFEATGTAKIYYGTLSSTRRGLPKIIETEDDGNRNEILIVLKSPIGFRGSNSITGDIKIDNEDKRQREYYDFPGNILVEGYIAQGIAGRMGNGKQLIFTIEKDKVFRVGYSGRLYGEPDEHFYMWDGEKLYALTKEERDVSEIF